MPLLTTCLLFNADLDLASNMAALKKAIKLNSLTQDELFVKQAMKNSELHEKAVSLITAAMHSICDDKNATATREVNTEAFLKNLN